MSNLLIDAIMAGGGYNHIARELHVDPATVYRWRNGMPKTEWLPYNHPEKTNYCRGILECIERKNKIRKVDGLYQFKTTRTALLEASIDIQAGAYDG